MRLTITYTTYNNRGHNIIYRRFINPLFSEHNVILCKGTNASKRKMAANTLPRTLFLKTTTIEATYIFKDKISNIYRVFDMLVEN